jgi:L-aminopeptidase/D-esterase-like protein
MAPQAALSAGFRVGHWTAPDGSTGCTVILPPPGTVASLDIRGSSPGSRELAPLDLERQRTEVHGLLFTGGSAFGLAAADGVMRWLEEKGIGFQTPIGPIPIVPAAVIFDAAAGTKESRPGPDAGSAACEAAAE